MMGPYLSTTIFCSSFAAPSCSTAFDLSASCADKQDSSVQAVELCVNLPAASQLRVWATDAVPAIIPPTVLQLNQVAVTAGLLSLCARQG